MGENRRMLWYMLLSMLFVSRVLCEEFLLFYNTTNEYGNVVGYGSAIQTAPYGYYPWTGSLNYSIFVGQPLGEGLPSGTVYTLEGNTYGSYYGVQAKGSSMDFALDGGIVVGGYDRSPTNNLYGSVLLKYSPYPNSTLQTSLMIQFATDSFADSVRTSGYGGYLLVGSLRVSSTNDDAIILYLGSDNDIVWVRGIRGNSFEGFSDITTETEIDSMYVACGYTYTYGSASHDGLLAKIDIYGQFQWSYAYGGGGSDYFSSVVATPDGGCIAVGTSSYSPGYRADIWVVKVDTSGAVQWSVAIGGDQEDYGYSVVATNDDQYIIAGKTYSIHSNLKSSGIIFRINGTGAILWATVIGYELDAFTGVLDVSEGRSGGFTFTGSISSDFDGSVGIPIIGNIPPDGFYVDCFNARRVNLNLLHSIYHTPFRSSIAAANYISPTATVTPVAFTATSTWYYSGQ
jgi:hypothetical protein